MKIRRERESEENPLLEKKTPNRALERANSSTRRERVRKGVRQFNPRFLRRKNGGKVTAVILCWHRISTALFALPVYAADDDDDDDADGGGRTMVKHAELVEHAQRLVDFGWGSSSSGFLLTEGVFFCSYSCSSGSQWGSLRTFCIWNEAHTRGHVCCCATQHCVLHLSPPSRYTHTRGARQFYRSQRCNKRDTQL